jgi:glycosyltransferase involved in cell wall biosynthesis
MRIGLIGDFSEFRDEGQKAIAHSLATELSRRHEITRLNIRSVFSREFWRKVKDANLQLIHYVPGPTIKSLAVCRIIAVYHNAKVVISAPQPTFSTLSENLIPALKPDLVLVQSEQWAKRFEAHGCATSFAPNGVDTDRFVPISAEHRQEVRKRFDIDNGTFLVLHVGHITHRRNVQTLARVQKSGKQVLMIASEFTRADENLHQLLTTSGCRVLKGYVPDIEQVYAMSDCYIFPTEPGSTILTPLSVLEAMACNVPVVSTRFEGLLELFEAGDGLFFADSDTDIVRAIENLENNSVDVRTREKVRPYSWHYVAERIEQSYQQLLEDA